MLLYCYYICWSLSIWQNTHTIEHINPESGMKCLLNTIPTSMENGVLKIYSTITKIYNKDTYIYQKADIWLTWQKMPNQKEIDTTISKRTFVYQSYVIGFGNQFI